MQGSRLDFMKRKEAKHTAERVGGKGEWQQEEWKKKSKRGRRKSDGRGGGGREGGREGLTWDGII